MEQLYKIGEWLWRNKERMVLGAMVLVLSFRVYKVVRPNPVPNPVVHPPVRDDVPPNWPAGPPRPSAPPAPPSRVDYQSLVRANPFTMRGGAATPTGPSQPSEEDLGIRLKAIRPWKGGAFAAQIEVVRSRKTDYFQVNEEVEGFRILEINKDQNYVEVYSNATQKRHKLQPR